MLKLFSVSDHIDDAALCNRRTLTIAGRWHVWWPFPVASAIHSSCAVVFGCPVYGGKKRWWVKPTYRAFKRISNARYWLTYRLHPLRYHWLDTGLPPGYADPSEVLLYAMMAALGRYIDEMGGLENIERFNADLRAPENYDPNAPGEVGEMECHQADRQETASSIWYWWTVQLPAHRKRRDELLHRLYGNRHIETKPTENPNLVEYVPPRFTDEEEELHKEFRALEEQIDEDTQRMLHRLVDIRNTLWT